LMVGVLILVPAFGSSDALSHVYGIAVAAVMLVTLVLLVVVMWRTWKWRLRWVLLFTAVYLLIDGGFLVATPTRRGSGRRVPLVTAAFTSGRIAIGMSGRAGRAERTRRDEMPLQLRVERRAKRERHTVLGTAGFLTADSDGAPTALRHGLKHSKVV